MQQNATAAEALPRTPSPDPLAGFKGAVSRQRGEGKGGRVKEEGDEGQGARRRERGREGRWNRAADWLRSALSSQTAVTPCMPPPKKDVS